MIFSVLDEIHDMMDDQKMDISRFSDESRILDVTWEVVYCSKRYLLSTHSQHDGR